MLEMTARQQIRDLARASAKTFGVSFEELFSGAKWRPLVHFRHLTWLVARERGYGPRVIARTFGADPTTVQAGIATAREHVTLYDWWANRKADLVDAWDEIGG